MNLERIKLNDIKNLPIKLQTKIIIKIVDY